jgi:hypothetical protein
MCSVAWSADVWSFLKGYPVFVGIRYQRGHGLGSIFGGLFKAAMPLLKKGAKTLGREALKPGLNIAGDVVQGRNIKQAAKCRCSPPPPH